MNCKQGDLAVKVRAHAGDKVPAGAIVQCLEFAAYRTNWTTGEELRNVWRVEWSGGARGMTYCVCDDLLRPIRDSDGADETLAWAGLPQPVTEPA